ncbi:MAG: acetolactate synthase large subunit [Nitrospinota bacterium]
MKTADLFVQALENEGVQYIFGIPGEENLDLLDSLKDSSIKLILTRHEQGAGFMAATVGRLTGKTGVCMATLGPGATNLVTPAAYAQLGGMPLLMITGQKPIRKSKQGQFQIVNIVDMMRPLTKYAASVVDGHRVPEMIREAFRLAQEERPGATHIEIAEDIAREESEATLYDIHPKTRPQATDKAIMTAVAMIEEATRPLILIGAGAMRKQVDKEILAFVEKTGIPFFNTQMAKGLIDERHPLFMGTAALSSSDYLHCAIEKADLIINLGHDVIEKPPFIMEKGGTKVIHVNFFFSRVDDVYFPQLDVVGDIGENVKLLTGSIEKQSSWDITAFTSLKSRLDAHISECAKDETFPILPQRLVADVRRAMPDDGIITLDNGVYKIWFARNYPACQPNTILLDNALASMGAGLPSGIAARLVYPDRKILAICGDGGFMMNSQELETAVRLKMDIVCIVLNDSSYGMIKWKQNVQDLEVQGLDFGNPDFVKYAESYGAHGHRVESNAGLFETLTNTLNTPGVHLIDCPVNYKENTRVLIDELKQITCTL